MSNLFFLEPLLVERIRAHVPDLRRVVAALELGDAKSQGQIVPACYVIYGGDDPDVSGPEGETLTDQYWLAVLAVKTSARDEGLSREAGLLLTQIDVCLRGFRPPTAGVIDPLVRVTSPSPLFEDGFTYFALRYRARITLA